MNKTMRWMIAGCLLAPMVALAMDCAPFQLSLAGKAQIIPKDKAICGLRLNLPMGDNVQVSGLDLGFISKSGSASALQVNLLNMVEKDFTGIGVGLFNTANSVSGLQVGLFNTADDASGLQVGLFNRTVSMQGMQIGVINIIEQGPIVFFPGVNFAF